MAFRGLVLYHPVGNTSGRMTVLSSITGGLVWCYFCRLVLYFRCVSNSELFTFMQKTWFVIMKLWRMLCNNLWLVYLWTRLRVSFLYKYRSCDVSDLPGPTRQRRLLYYCLMAKRSGLGNNMELTWAVLSQLASELHLYTRGLNTPLTTCFTIKLARVRCVSEVR
jgi:hypothetical protein